MLYCHVHIVQMYGTENYTIYTLALACGRNGDATVGNADEARGCGVGRAVATAGVSLRFSETERDGA